MTISIWLMILTIGVGATTRQSIESTPMTAESITREGKVAGNCWINGTWYNPCPTDAPPPPPGPEPSPEILLP